MPNSSRINGFTIFFFLLACALGAFIALSDVAPLAHAPRLYEEVEDLLALNPPWYVWVYTLSAVGAAVTFIHETIRYVALDVGYLVKSLLWVATPVLNTWQFVTYTWTFLSIRRSILSGRRLLWVGENYNNRDW